MELEFHFFKLNDLVEDSQLYITSQNDTYLL